MMPRPIVGGASFGSCSLTHGWLSPTLLHGSKEPESLMTAKLKGKAVCPSGSSQTQEIIKPNKVDCRTPQPEHFCRTDTFGEGLQCPGIPIGRAHFSNSSLCSTCLSPQSATSSQRLPGGAASSILLPTSGPNIILNPFHLLAPSHPM